MTRTFIFVIALLLPAIVFCQATDRKGAKFVGKERTKVNGTVVSAVVINGDTVPVVNLRPFNMVADRHFNSDKERDYYNRLKRDVKKVYPYARLAGEKFREYNIALGGMKKKKEQKHYLKKIEKELKEEFGDELKDLTIRQGTILMRLVDRETGNTSYEIVKEFRGMFSAFFWQSLARLFGHNMKTEYDAAGDDKLIEEIVLAIEAGQAK